MVGLGFLAVLVTLAALPPTLAENEYPTYDGWYHNENAPSWGGVDTHLVRRVPPAYADGVYEPPANRPNPRTLSNALMSGLGGLGSLRNRTALMTYFGQQIVEEMVDVQRQGCPPEFINIPIERCDPQYDPACLSDSIEIPLLRSRFDKRTGSSPNNPRQQLNEITPYLDAGLFYGTSRAWSDALRSFKDGELLASDDGLFPAINNLGLPMANPAVPAEHILKPVQRFFRLGNPRGNENPFLLSFGILFFREHNYQARRLKALQPNATDEYLYNEARMWVMALYQSITVNEWLPAFLNDTLPPYTGYDNSVHPGVSHAFQTSAFRFGHTLVTPGVFRRNRACNFTAMPIRTCNSYFNSQDIVRDQDDGTVDSLLLGMASQLSEREDPEVIEDLRGFVFGPLEFSRRDLMAINIQRGRDHGMASHNAVRVAFGLPAFTNFSQIHPDPAVWTVLRDLCEGDIERVDLFVGGLLETVDGPGETFKAIIIDQFQRTRDGDRWWYANRRQGHFSEAEIAEIEATRLSDIIIRNTNITAADIQADVFVHLAGDPCPQPYQMSPADVPPCTPNETFDYFDASDSGAQIAIILAAIVLFTLATIFWLWYMVRCKRQRAKQVTASATLDALNQLAASTSGQFFAVFDHSANVQHLSTIAPDRVSLKTAAGRSSANSKGGHLCPGVPIYVYVPGRRSSEIVTFDDSLSIMSRTPVADVHSMLVSRIGKRFMLLVRLPKHHDLLYAFADTHTRSRFSAAIIASYDVWCPDETLRPTVREGSRKDLIKFMKSKKERSRELRIFFDCAVRQSMLPSQDTSDREFLETQLSTAEFASAFDMAADSFFVQRFMTLMDPHHEGYVTFHSLLNFLVLFSQGSLRDKQRFMFDLCDIDSNGRISHGDFLRLLESCASVSRSVDLSDPALLNDTVRSLFLRQGLNPETDELTFDNFLLVMQDHESVVRRMNMSSAVLRSSMKDLSVAPPPHAPVSSIKSLVRTHTRNNVEVPVASSYLMPEPRSFLTGFPALYGRTAPTSAQDITEIGMSHDDSILHLNEKMSPLASIASVSSGDDLDNGDVVRRPNKNKKKNTDGDGDGDGDGDPNHSDSSSEGGHPVEYIRMSTLGGSQSGGSKKVSSLPSGRYSRSHPTPHADDGTPEGSQGNLSRPPVSSQSSQPLGSATSLYNSRSGLMSVNTPSAFNLGGAASCPVSPRGGGAGGGVGDARRMSLSYGESSAITVARKLEVTSVETQMRALSWMARWRRYIRYHRSQLIILWVYVCMTALIFVERAYVYSVERESRGLRRMAGYGVTVTRGAASVIMWTFALLLLTMCRNFLTALRGTSLGRIFPFDDIIPFHKIIAYTLLFFTGMHLVGHFINFYHVATQRADDLRCIFRDVFYPTHVLPSFSWWVFNTTTGFSGVLATLVFIVIYVFASRYARRFAYTAFYLTHHLFVLLFLLVIIHGSANLVQEPIFQYFLFFPAIAYTIDKIVSMRRQSRIVTVVNAKLLPSHVLRLTMVKPKGFTHMSGQWVRIACPSITSHAFHPFTITSSPHDDQLTLHIRAVGPWTRRIRELYSTQLPPLLLDGPYGGAQQHWLNYRVVVLIGAGIGVTPFASILKDLLRRIETGRLNSVDKVYFFWVCRSQHQYEWMTDILRELEQHTASKDCFEVHMFITQMRQQFDLRTMMLYVCEKELQRVSGRSIFTGLRSHTHFGRPAFPSLFENLQQLHTDARSIGVFSCGPPTLTDAVDEAVDATNRFPGPRLHHTAENF